jgi:hypothetical protein
VDGRSFNQELEGQRGFIYGDRHIFERLRVRLGKLLAALGTLIALQPIAVLRTSLFRSGSLWQVTVNLLEIHSQKPDTGVVGPVRLRLCGSRPDDGSSRYRALLFTLLLYVTPSPT